MTAELTTASQTRKSGLDQVRAWRDAIVNATHLASRGDIAVALQRVVENMTGHIDAAGDNEAVIAPVAVLAAAEALVEADRNWKLTDGHIKALAGAIAVLNEDVKQAATSSGDTTLSVKVQRALVIARDVRRLDKDVTPVGGSLYVKDLVWALETLSASVSSETGAPCAIAVPRQRGLYAWVSSGSPVALVNVHSRPTDRATGGSALNGEVLKSSAFNDGYPVERWTGGRWFGPLRNDAPVIPDHLSRGIAQ